MHSLVRAKQMDFDVPASMMDKGMRYLKQIERHIPNWYSKRSRDAIVAYSLMVRTLNGDVDSSKAAQLMKGGPDSLSLEALGWILPTLQAGGKGSEVSAIKRYLVNRASVTTSTAHFTTSYEDGAHVLRLHRMS